MALKLAGGYKGDKGSGNSHSHQMPQGALVTIAYMR